MTEACFLIHTIRCICIHFYHFCMTCFLRIVTTDSLIEMQKHFPQGKILFPKVSFFPLFVNSNLSEYYYAILCCTPMLRSFSLFPAGQVFLVHHHSQSVPNYQMRLIGPVVLLERPRSHRSWIKVMHKRYCIISLPFFCQLFENESEDVQLVTENNTFNVLGLQVFFRHTNTKYSWEKKSISMCT